MLALMEQMQVRLVSVVERDGCIRARLNATAPAIGVRVWLEVEFERAENFTDGDCVAEAYDRALAVLDPA